MKPVTALIILDGFGCSDNKEGNAISADGVRNIMEMFNRYPHTKLYASGRHVGLPDGQMGNSEVGHLNIGAGRIVYQELTRISKSIEDGDFFRKPEFLKAINACKTHNTSLHLMGLCSDGGVHSHLEHLYALVRLARDNGLERVYIHCFMDGRDVPPESGKGYIESVQAKLRELGCGRIATVTGRYYAMDRDNRYERTKMAYDAIARGVGTYAQDPAEAVGESYAGGVTDEFIVPTVVSENGKPIATLGENDSVIFFNFRPDRARQLTRALIFEDFDAFEREKGFFPLTFVSMTQYDKAFENRLLVAFKPDTPDNTLGKYLSDIGLRQLRIAETEKYAHVTFFFNGGVEAPYPNEDRALIPSPKVATYDLKPEMSAYEVADEAAKRIASGVYDVMILNFANPDMVGHTGDMEAAVAAVHTVDKCVRKVLDAVLLAGGRAIITADHGNCEKMRAEDGTPFTAHTSNPVPFILADQSRLDARLKESGRLCDIAPTLLDLMGLEKPAEMTGESILLKQ